MKFNKGDAKALGLVAILGSVVVGASMGISRVIDNRRYNSLPVNIQSYDLNRNGVLEMNEAKALLNSSLYMMGESISAGGNPMMGSGATPSYRETSPRDK